MRNRKTKSIVSVIAILMVAVTAHASGFVHVGAGKVGINTDTPVESLTMVSPDATSGVGIRLEDLNEVTTDTFRLQLKNNEFRLAFQNGGQPDLVIENGSGIVADLDITAPVFHGDLDGDVLLRSDRTQKADVEPVDVHAIMRSLRSIGVSTWSYTDDPSTRHIGPMAQDFGQHFGAPGDRSIRLIDYLGTYLAGLQALDERLQTLEYSACPPHDG